MSRYLLGSKGLMGRDLSRVRMSDSAKRELAGFELVAYLAAWSLFLVVAYLCCALAVSWSLT